MLKTVWEKYRIYGFGKFFRYIFAELFRFLYWALVRGSYTQEREDLIIDKLLNYKKRGLYQCNQIYRRYRMDKKAKKCIQ